FKMSNNGGTIYLDNLNNYNDEYKNEICLGNGADTIDFSESARYWYNDTKAVAIKGFDENDALAFSATTNNVNAKGSDFVISYDANNSSDQLVESCDVVFNSVDKLNNADTVLTLFDNGTEQNSGMKIADGYYNFVYVEALKDVDSEASSVSCNVWLVENMVYTNYYDNEEIFDGTTRVKLLGTIEGSSVTIDDIAVNVKVEAETLEDDVYA
ncbi:MAG: hypothetical protein J5846_08230, partial [Desulfovibrio sp.]|nr:hypothetical protein [Desulfovibrio sp.]